MNRRQPWVGLFLFSLATLAADPARAGFGDLVQRLPDDANTLVLFNVQEILASPLAVKENWQARQERAYGSHWIVVPPGTNRYAMAAQVEFGSMHPLWQAGVAELQFEPSMPKAAALYGGSVDEIDKCPVAALPPDLYAVKFGKQWAGFLRPANRQDAGRWIDEVYGQGARNPLSVYLNEGVSFADKLGTPIIIALDLKHVFPVEFIRGRLGALQSLKDQNLDLDQLATSLASIRGVTLGITITEQVYGKIKVDFEQDVAVPPAVAKGMLLEALANHGAMIDEFEQWQAEVNGKQITLGGYLQESGMKRIFSLLESPPELQARPSATPADTQQTEERMRALSSQQYFNAVEGLLKDLRGKRQSDDSVTWGQVGLWFERYAGKIDQLPILNVDSELVDWGTNVAAQLRQAETSMKGIGSQTAYRLATTPNVEAYSYRTATVAGVGPYGGYAGGAYAYAYNPRLSLALQGQQDAQIRTEERIRGNTSANLIMQGLQAETGQIRKRMTQKYQIEF